MRNTRLVHLRISDIKEESIRLFFEHLQVRKCASGTFRHKQHSLNRFFAWLKKQHLTVKDVQRKDLDKYHLHLKDAKLADNTVFHEMANLRVFFRYLEKIHYIFLNPAADMMLSVPTRKLPYIPSEEDIRKLLAYPRVTLRAGIRDRTFMETMYATGARIEELASVSIHDLNLERGLIRLFGKGRKERLVPLTGKAVRWIKEYLKRRHELLKDDPDEEALWLNTWGSRLSYQGAEKIVLRNSKGAGLRPFSNHTIRRACATHMLQHGAHPILIQQLLGHSTMGHLSKYLQVSVPHIKAMHKQSKLGR